MHSHDPQKDWYAFQAEIQAIFRGQSKHHHPADRFDFRGFVFTQKANFSDATFTRDADFLGATFNQNANFFGATFTQDANFARATFIQEANFLEATFTRNANLRRATFVQNANFFRATFTQNADFSETTFNGNVNFFRATFTQNADFFRAMFTQNANFFWAMFTQNADFSEAVVVGVLDLQFAKVLKDGEILLHRVNRVEEVKVPDSEAEVKPGENPPERNVHVRGLRVRLRNTLIEGMRFEDVRWFQREGRLVLQDELDLDDPEQRATHELVADAYRRLVNNFEKARQYEWAEQAVVGEMEMRRRNPERFLLAGWARAEGRGVLRRGQRWVGERARKKYRMRRWARWFGEHVSSIYLYRLLSFYGTSYRRALLALVIFLLLFALAFLVTGLRPRDAAESALVSWAKAWHHPDREQEMWSAFVVGLVATLETATLRREPAYLPANNPGRILAAAELIVIPGQVALVLLALRRRFRR